MDIRDLFKGSSGAAVTGGLLGVVLSLFFGGGAGVLAIAGLLGAAGGFGLAQTGLFDSAGPTDSSAPRVAVTPPVRPSDEAASPVPTPQGLAPGQTEAHRRQREENARREIEEGRSRQEAARRAEAERLALVQAERLRQEAARRAEAERLVRERVERERQEARESAENESCGLAAQQHERDEATRLAREQEERRRQEAATQAEEARLRSEHEAQCRHAAMLHALPRVRASDYVQQTIQRNRAFLERKGRELQAICERNPAMTYRGVGETGLYEVSVMVNGQATTLYLNPTNDRLYNHPALDNAPACRMLNLSDYENCRDFTGPLERATVWRRAPRIEEPAANAFKALVDRQFPRMADASAGSAVTLTAGAGEADRWELVAMMDEHTYLIRNRQHPALEVHIDGRLPLPANFRDSLLTIRQDYENERRDPAQVASFDLPRDRPIGYLHFNGMGSDSDRTTFPLSVRLPQYLAARGYDIVTSDPAQPSTTLIDNPAKAINRRIVELHQRGVRDFVIDISAHGSEQGIHPTFGQNSQSLLTPAEVEQILRRYGDCNFTLLTTACHGGGLNPLMQNFQDVPGAAPGRVTVITSTKSFSVTSNDYMDQLILALTREDMTFGAAHRLADRASRQYYINRRETNGRVSPHWIDDAQFWRSHPDPSRRRTAQIDMNAPTAVPALMRDALALFQSGYDPQTIAPLQTIPVSGLPHRTGGSANERLS